MAHRPNMTDMESRPYQDGQGISATKKIAFKTKTRSDGAGLKTKVRNKLRVRICHNKKTLQTRANCKTKGVKTMAQKAHSLSHQNGCEYHIVFNPSIDENNL